MTRVIHWCGVAAIVALMPAFASAQHEGHQAAGQPAGNVDAAQVAACVESQRQTSALVDAANARIEAARQTNQPAAMRSAIEDLQMTLSTIRTAMANCTQLQSAAATGMPAGHNMANMPGAPNASSSPPSAPGTPVMNPGSTQTAPAAAGPPAATAGAAANEHAGNGAAAAPAAPASPAPKMVMVMTATDPARLKCPAKIDPKTVPKTTYKGKTYYFCSATDRAEFLTDPDMSLSMRPPL